MLIEELFDKFKNICYDESCNIAAEKGKAPAFDARKHVSGSYVQRLDKAVRRKISTTGLRNCCILTVPPVGSGAILAGTSSGIEPIFALKYRRRSKSLSGGTFDVHHPLAVERKKRLGARGKESDAFVTAHEINPSFRVQLQGKIQRHIDSSISSTVNLPETATEDDVEQIFLQAWRAGCKGITVYREGSREGILLSGQLSK